MARSASCSGVVKEMTLKRKVSIKVEMDKETLATMWIDHHYLLATILCSLHIRKIDFESTPLLAQVALAPEYCLSLFTRHLQAGNHMSLLDSTDLQAPSVVVPSS